VNVHVLLLEASAWGNVNVARNPVDQNMPMKAAALVHGLKLL